MPPACCAPPAPPSTCATPPESPARCTPPPSQPLGCAGCCGSRCRRPAGRRKTKGQQVDHSLCFVRDVVVVDAITLRGRRKTTGQQGKGVGRWRGCCGSRTVRHIWMQYRLATRAGRSGSAQAQRAAPQRLQLCGGAQPTAGRQQAVRGQQGSALVLLCSSMTPAPISAPLPCNPTHIRPSPAGAHLNNAHASRHSVALAVHIRPKGSLCRPQRRQHSICGVTCGNSRGGIAGTCTQTLEREIHPTLQLTARMRCSIGKGPSEGMCAPAAHSSWSKCTSAPSLPPGPADRLPGRHTSRPSSWLASLLPPAPAPHPNSTNPREKKQSGARFYTRTNTRAHAHLSLVAAPKNRLAPAAPPPPRAPPRQAPGRVGKS